MVSNSSLTDRGLPTRQLTIKSLEGLESLKQFIRDKEIDKEVSLDRIIYGFEAQRLLENGKTKVYIFFLSHSVKRNLEFVSKGGKTLRTLDITKVTQVDFGVKRGNFTKLNTKTLKKYKEELCLSLLINSESIDFIFNNIDEINQFCLAIAHIWQDEIDEENNSDTKRINIKQIWNKYDDDLSGKLEIKEFSGFLTEIRINNKKNLQAEELFNKVDTDRSGKIDFDEFVKYYEELTSANEFTDVFKKYSNNKDILEIYDLTKFIFEVQNENVNIDQAIRIILTYNKDIPEDEAKKIQTILDNPQTILKADLSEIPENLRNHLHLTLNHFQNFLSDNVANNAMNKFEQSMDHPLNEYFVYSSHNTYLKGHQLYGDSSVEMYAYAIRLGCRCVELDCWDGKNNEPKITHGMTFTSDILFKDALQVIKENAFKNTEYPFFLSIEMHCGDEQQKVMANYIQTILVDIWIPENDGIPHLFPSPNQLKGKFIVKCKRPKVVRKEVIIEEKKEIIEVINDENNELDKKKIFILKKHMSLLDDLNNNENPTVKNRNIRLSLKNMILTGDNQLLNTVKKLEEDKTLEDKKNIAIEELKKNKKTIKEVVPEMYITIGLISVGLQIDQIKQSNYQPWDVVSLSESKVNKLYESNREQLIEFTTNSFLRVYPKGTRIDSSNYDPVKSWICGAQLVSLNLQSLEDDYTLLNDVFFQLNNETGYVLKPSYLRNSPMQFKKYSSPAFSLNLSVLSGTMLQNIMKESSQEIYVTVSVLGTNEDNKNTVLRTDPVKTNFLHPLFSSNSITFSIFEENLSFLIIKIYDNKGWVLARSVLPVISLMEGYRTVTLYNNLCEEIKNSNIIVFNKKF